MITYVMMSLVLLFLGADLLWGVRLCDYDHFFDKENSNALRGFWCIIIILVHVPLMYQNRIQDMLGSFAYIGVTFFFLTSGYGLTLSEGKNHSGGGFWRKRLPTLLIVNWLVNLITVPARVFICHEKFNPWDLLFLAKWLCWLLGCYFIFWLCLMIFRGRRKLGYFACMLLVVSASAAIYILKSKGVITDVTWVVECFGFVWGIMFALTRKAFINFARDHWLGKVIASAVLMLALGAAYLKFKPLVFFGDYLLKTVLGVSITLFMLICNVRMKLGNPVSRFLGKISFEIYLIHFSVFYVLSGLLGDIPSGVFVVLSIVVSIAISAAIHLVAQLLIGLVYRIPIMSKVKKSV